MFSLLSIITVLGFAAATSAQSVQPSNATIPPALSGVELELRLRSANSYRGSIDFTIHPLTLEAGLNATSAALRTWNILGSVTYVGANNANAIGRNDIAYINCEQSTTTQFTPSQIVQAAASQLPKAIVLYSKRATGCTLDGTFGYNSIYTITKPGDGAQIEGYFNTFPGGQMIDGWITADTTSGSGNNNGPGGPPPPTTVAMSILYTVTGLITLLFLVIIITGALRARRNPERYGPRRALNGRPSRSRAKGLAMAMLETIPIVKFGDPEPAKPGSHIELEDGSNTNSKTTTTTTTADKVGATKPEEKSATPAVGGAVVAAEIASGMGKAESLNSAKDNERGGDGDIGCSICTEDFTAGEDVRLLPCRHKFHPACVDPWLLNVSGTCPLCRHDLNPAEPTPEETAPEAGATVEPSPPPVAAETPVFVDPAARNRRRVSRFFELNRLRNAPPDERIAALRALREEGQSDTTTTPHVTEEPSRRRLRDRLHMGSRSNEAPIVASPTVSSSTPPATSTSETPRRT